jgi:hypothetical protein
LPAIVACASSGAAHPRANRSTGAGAREVPAPASASSASRAGFLAHGAPRQAGGRLRQKAVLSCIFLNQPPTYYYPPPAYYEPPPACYEPPPAYYYAPPPTYYYPQPYYGPSFSFGLTVPIH